MSIFGGLCPVQVAYICGYPAFAVRLHLEARGLPFFIAFIYLSWCICVMWYAGEGQRPIGGSQVSPFLMLALGLELWSLALAAKTFTH